MTPPTNPTTHLECGDCGDMDHHCRPKSPLYAGQTVSVLNDAQAL